MNDKTPNIREIELADAKNILNQITGRASDLVRGSFQDEVKPKGQFTFELIDAESGEVDQREVLNTVVDEGENEILNWIAGNALTNSNITYDGFRYLAVGTDGTSVTDGDTSLGSESERIDLDPNTNSGEYSRDESSVTITGTWLFGTGQANGDIAEAGLFYVPPGDATQGTADDYMLNRTVVSPTIDKSSSQELKVTWTLLMTQVPARQQAKRTCRLNVTTMNWACLTTTWRTCYNATSTPPTKVRSTCCCWPGIDGGRFGVYFSSVISGAGDGTRILMVCIKRLCGAGGHDRCVV